MLRIPRFIRINSTRGWTSGARGGAGEWVGGVESERQTDKQSGRRVKTTGEKGRSGRETRGREEGERERERRERENERYRQTDRQTDGRTDGQTDRQRNKPSYAPPPPTLTLSTLPLSVPLSLLSPSLSSSYPSRAWQTRSHGRINLPLPGARTRQLCVERERGRDGGTEGERRRDGGRLVSTYLRMYVGT